jgi:hypothetical protein
MSTAAPIHSSHPVSRTHLLPIAVAASVVQMAMMIPGYNEGGDFQVGPWLSVLAFSLVVGGLVFAFVVPTGRPLLGAVVGGIALASVLVFWAGVTLPLAAAAATMGWQAREGEERALAWTAVGMAAVSTVALVAIIIGDALAN